METAVTTFDGIHNKKTVRQEKLNLHAQHCKTMAFPSPPGSLQPIMWQY